MNAMKVTVILVGILSEKAGLERLELELPDGATFGCLMIEIGKRLGISHVAVVKVRNRIRERWERLHGQTSERSHAA